MQRQAIVMANWKMNGDRALVRTFCHQLAAQSASWQTVQVVICPPAVLLDYWSQQRSSPRLALGAQDVSEFAHGAHTGEHSVSLLQEAGAQYVLIGHSERRQHYGDSFSRVAAKVQQVLQQSTLTAVLCVGEQAEQRQAAQTLAVIAAQLESALTGITQAQLARLVLAYEPVWAIGTGLTATPAEAQQVHAFIRQWLSNKWGASGRQVAILYGGSVKPENAEALFAEADIDGGLIGGASLSAEDFLAICHAAQTRSN